MLEPKIEDQSLANPYENTNRHRSFHAMSYRFFRHQGEIDTDVFFLDWIKSGQPQKYAELGCGNGNATREAMMRLPSSFEVTGVDLYPSLNKESYIHQTDFKKLPYPDNSLGRIASIASLGCYAESQEELTAHFMEVYRVLAPGGKALFSPIPEDQQLKDNVIETLFPVQIPSKGLTGSVKEGNYFLCPIMQLAEIIGFKCKVSLRTDDYIQGIELTK